MYDYTVYFCANVCMMYVSRDSRENSTPELMESLYNLRMTNKFKK